MKSSLSLGLAVCLAFGTLARAESRPGVGERDLEVALSYLERRQTRVHEPSSADQMIRTGAVMTGVGAVVWAGAVGAMIRAGLDRRFGYAESMVTFLVAAPLAFVSFVGTAGVGLMTLFAYQSRDERLTRDPLVRRRYALSQLLERPRTEQLDQLRSDPELAELVIELARTIREQDQLVNARFRRTN